MKLDWALLNQVLLLGIALVRIAAAFAMMPMFAPQTIPPLIRNSICVAFGLIVLMLQPQAGVLNPTVVGWIALFVREVFIGLLIGFFFGTVLWAYETAGQMVDAKIGAGAGQLSDPFTGEVTSVTGSLFGRFAMFVFMLSGGLGLVVHTMLASYVIWPIAPEAPRLRLVDTHLVEGNFARLMALSIAIASPALVLLTTLEGGMGLIGRFTPQLNIFATSLAVKSWLAVLVVMATLGLLGSTVVQDTLDQPGKIISLLGFLGRN